MKRNFPIGSVLDFDTTCLANEESQMTKKPAITSDGFSRSLTTTASWPCALLPRQSTALTLHYLYCSGIEKPTLFADLGILTI